MNRTIRRAFWAGIISVILGLLTGAATLFYSAITGSLFTQVSAGSNILYNLPLWFLVPLTISYAISLVLQIFYFVGFAVIGRTIRSKILSIGSYLALAFSIVYVLYTIITLYVPLPETLMLVCTITWMVLLGIAGTLMGIGLLKTKHHIGTIGTVTAIFTIIGYASMITIILLLVGWIAILAATILHFVVLWKMSKVLH